MNVAVDVPIAALTGVLGPLSTLFTITPCSSLIVTPVFDTPSILLPSKVLLAQLSKSVKVLTSLTIEKVSKRAFIISSLASSSASLRTFNKASLDSVISTSTALFTAFFRLPAPRLLNSSESVYLARLTSVRPTRILSTIADAGPSISIKSAISAISLPASPKSLISRTREPITRSAAAIFLADQVTISSSVPFENTVLSAKNSAQYSSGSKSRVFLPTTVC